MRNIASTATKLVVFLLCITGALGADLVRMAEAGFSLAASNGELVIARLRPGQNAARDGLKVGDVLLRANGKAAVAESAFVRPLLRRSAGDRVEYLIRRDGKEMTVAVEYRGAPHEHADGIEIQYGAVDDGGNLRRTLVTIPTQKGKFPALLWIAGSGCASQESADGDSLQVRLLYQLTRRGIVTMRVEKTGVGDSDGPSCYGDSAGFDQEVRGYQAGIKALESSELVNPARIVLLGHSAGATLAPLVARGENGHAIVVAGAMGTTFIDYVLGMRRRELEFARTDKKETESSLAVTSRCLNRLLKDRRSPDEVEKESPGCEHRVRFDSPPLYIQDWADLDLQNAWRQAPNFPVLVLYGSADFITDEQESRALVEKINAAHPNRATLKILPMDHDFRAFGSQRDAWNAEQGVGAAGGLLPAVVDEIERFVKRR
jgi:hypothetical protein